MGREIARRFLEEGCTVAAFDINADGLTSLAEYVNKEVGTSIHLKTEAVDISSYDDVCRAVALVEDALGPIDVLVNNAGWDKFSNFLDTDADLRAKVVSTNLSGPINMMHVVLSRMADRSRGMVVSIASDAGRVGSSGQAVYSACKGGVIALTKTLARELARRNILLNVVCPGPTDTAMLQDFMNQGPGGEKVRDALLRAIPLKRLGQPSDVPGVVAFLASDDAAFITGQVISVSGGLTMHG
jgi:2-hydroxycyclohexanecarboxyl-CoA dehydrogenase